MQQRKKIHPHKFTMWIGIAGILMMFAGFTSAYIIKRNQAKWVTFDLPLAFWYSTAVIILSSVTLYLALRSFKNRQMAKYRQLITATVVLGIVFIALQFVGFRQLTMQGKGLGNEVSVDFLYVIIGVHAVHILGGIIALIVLFAKAFRTKVKSYDSVPVEVVSTYWHFVDVLWIYLLIFLVMIR